MQTRPMGIQIASQPIMVTTASGDNAVRRQDSTGAYPSPSTTSSDSSPDLVGSTSTGSFDQSPATEEPSDFTSESPQPLVLNPQSTSCLIILIMW